MSRADDRPVVIVSNRGPLSFTTVDGSPVAKRGSGGLVSGLAPLLDSGRASWTAAALSDADRSAIDDDGLARGAGLEVRLIDIDTHTMRRYYDDISNSTLWFVHHGLYDRVRAPAYDQGWWDAWEAYREVNNRFAESIAEHAPGGARVLVQDYHLSLVARRARLERDDLSFVHFHHTPFAGPEDFSALPPSVRKELLEGLSSHDACGFHTSNWETNYRLTSSRFGVAAGRTFIGTLNSDLDDLRTVAAGEACRTALDALEEVVGDRTLIARVDRMELSKNIVRGFAGYDRLLERRPDLRGRVVFAATCYPSRLGVEDYRRYHDEVIDSVALVNERWGEADWQPIHLFTDDDFPRSVALMRRYDVLLVNPIRDGLNLVAKEGPALNEHDGSLVLSTEAGAYSELNEACDGLFPFDIEATADALEAAIDRDPQQRAFTARNLEALATARTPADWLADQLEAG
ncbi:MAG: trehalose-6-phosphate synthase [Microthrixaceae bacterium]|nr:trehalose-6-phosphate synthase [Microthrixaceae bacterium]